MAEFDTNLEHTNELVDYLYGEGLIEKPIRRADGNRTNLMLTSSGLNLITELK